MIEHKPIDGFANIGKPVPNFRRQAAYDACKDMGLDESDRAHACVSGMAEQLERDKPYEAMEVGARYLDLTGAYRIMAVLLTAPEPAPVPVVSADDLLDFGTGSVTAEDHQDVYG